MKSTRAIVPRRGPAVNVRPAGEHADRKRYRRSRAKAELRRTLREYGYA